MPPCNREKTNQANIIPGCSVSRNLLIDAFRRLAPSKPSKGVAWYNTDHCPSQGIPVGSSELVPDIRCCHTQSRLKPAVPAKVLYEDQVPNAHNLWCALYERRRQNDEEEKLQLAVWSLQHWKLGGEGIVGGRPHFPPLLKPVVGVGNLVASL